ncbi:MAG: hypothetical protein LBG67_03305 [Campylobacteraceae bacterium]|jgi:hypothetical protein|nr:hypothetical protein [Campylobacteraceae bacterium]
MQSIQTPFLQVLKENKENPQFFSIIRKTTFELTLKKFTQLNNDVQKQARLDKLLMIFIALLEEEGVKDPKTISCVIDGLIKAVSHEKEQELYQTIYEKDRIEKLIETQKQSIKELISLSYETVETVTNGLNEEDKKVVSSGIEDAKLRGIEMFGILKETAEEAYLRAIERGDDLENTIGEIAKNFTIQAISEGKLNKKRIIEITSNLIEVASDLADSDNSRAKELLNGAVFGTKNGIFKSIEKFKNDIKFAPEEVEEFLGQSLEESKREFLKIEDDFIIMLKQAELRSNGAAAEVLADIIAKHNSSFAKLKRIGAETAEVLGDRIEILKEEASILEKEFLEKFKGFKKEASIRTEAFKEEMAPKTKKAAEDAKKLGARALEVAKTMMENTINSAKEAMNKDKDTKDKK